MVRNHQFPVIFLCCVIILGLIGCGNNGGKWKQTSVGSIQFEIDENWVDTSQSLKDIVKGVDVQSYILDPKFDVNTLPFSKGDNVPATLVITAYGSQKTTLKENADFFKPAVEKWQGYNLITSGEVTVNGLVGHEWIFTADSDDLIRSMPFKSYVLLVEKNNEIYAFVFTSTSSDKVDKKADIQNIDKIYNHVKNSIK